MSNALFRLNNEGLRASRDLCHRGGRFVTRSPPSLFFRRFATPRPRLTAAHGQYVRTIVDDFSGKRNLSFPFPVRFLRARVIMHATTAYRLHAAILGFYRVLEKCSEGSVHFVTSEFFFFFFFFLGDSRKIHGIYYTLSRFIFIELRATCTCNIVLYVCYIDITIVLRASIESKVGGAGNFSRISRSLVPRSWDRRRSIDTRRYIVGVNRVETLQDPRILVLTVVT